MSRMPWSWGKNRMGSQDAEVSAERRAFFPRMAAIVVGLLAGAGASKASVPPAQPLTDADLDLDVRLSLDPVPGSQRSEDRIQIAERKSEKHRGGAYRKGHGRGYHGRGMRGGIRARPLDTKWYSECQVYVTIICRR